ncbi:MAG: flagellar protein FlaG [Acidobacteriota bacterium]
MHVPAVQTAAAATPQPSPETPRPVGSARPRPGSSGASRPAPGPPAADVVARPPVEDLSATLQRIARALAVKAADLNVSVDESTGRIVVKIVDRETREVTRQVPPEELLELARHLREQTPGALVNETA